MNLTGVLLRKAYWRVVSALAVAAVSTIGIATLTSQVAVAHDIGWRVSTTNISVAQFTRDYAVPVNDAINEYNNYTDLSIYRLDREDAFIKMEQGNYGATGWDGGAVPRSGSTACVSWPGLYVTGYCNTTDRRLTNASVYFNDYYGAYWLPQFGARHELGHVFGLGHDPCDANSVMENGTCRPDVPQTLRTHEINLINSWY